MKAYELLDSPEKWTKGASARDGNGNPIKHFDVAARSWCVLGALAQCYGCDFPTQQLVIESSVGSLVTYWNDDPFTTFEIVQARLKELDI